MAFAPAMPEWVAAHLDQIPSEVIRFCGDVQKKSILDVGCGDMLADFGLLTHDPLYITGLDVHAHPYDVLARTAKNLEEQGVTISRAYSSRMTYVSYDGRRFPFPDNSFDLVYSWSAFEHIPDVREILTEIRRVVKPQGQIFLQVYPWFPSYWGSHLTDYITESFFHLVRPNEWVYDQLKRYCSAHPEKADFVLGHMWREYQTLNKYSANMFLSDIGAAGFAIERVEGIIRTDHLDELPEGISRNDAMSAGTLAILRSAK